MRSYSSCVYVSKRLRMFDPGDVHEPVEVGQPIDDGPHGRPVRDVELHGLCLEAIGDESRGLLAEPVDGARTKDRAGPRRGHLARDGQSDATARARHEDRATRQREALIARHPSLPALLPGHPGLDLC